MNNEPDFTEDELTEAFRGAADPVDFSETHFEKLRFQLLTHTTDATPTIQSGVDSADQARVEVRNGTFASMRRFSLPWKLAAMVVTIVLILITTRPFGETAAAGLRSALDATRHEAWIHATTVVEYKGESTESESWCSPQYRIAAFRSPQVLHFVNYAEGIQSSFSKHNNAVYRWRADMNAEHIGRTFVHALLTDGDLTAAFPFHEVSEVARTRIRFDGQLRVQYSFKLQFKNDPSIRWNTVVQVDRSNGRIVSWKEQHSNGMNIATTFDYPESGPNDIYDLGTSTDAKVIDRVASSDVVELAERFQQEVFNFGNYEAIVIDRLQAEDNTSAGQPLLRRLQRAGKTFRVDLLTSINPNVAVPSDADLAWWKANRQNFKSTLLAECDGETCTVYPETDSRLDIATEMLPRVMSLSTLPVVALKNSSGATTVPVWSSIWPEYACRPMLMTSDPTLHFEIDPAGTNGPPNSIRLRLLTPDSPFSTERASYWLSMDHEHCVVKSNITKSSISQASIDNMNVALVENHTTFEYSGFEQSPTGITFATRRTMTDKQKPAVRNTTFILEFPGAK